VAEQLGAEPDHWQIVLIVVERDVVPPRSSRSA
jgi:hypothetical protein